MRRRFTSFYWAQQASTALTLIVLTEAGALLGGLAYGFTRPKPRLGRLDRGRRPRLVEAGIETPRRCRGVGRALWRR